MDLHSQSETEGGGSFRRQAWADWTDAIIIQAWLRWRDKASKHHRSLTDTLVASLGPIENANILDLASGLGEPAFSLAEAVGPKGRVTASEITPEFVGSILEHRDLGSVKNLCAIQAEACAIPFPDQSFDIVTCQLGAMYFVPVKKAFEESLRVLKPGGKVAILTWGMPEQGTFFANCVFPFLARTNIDPPPTDAPTPFRFSPPTRLTTELENAGFIDVKETREIVDMIWPGEPEELWQCLYETSASFRTIFDSLSQEAFGEAKAESLALMGKDATPEATTTSAEIVIGTGTKPI